MTIDLRERLQASLIGAYTLERELGGGGMSRVFLAEETALGRKVVVKVLPPEMAESLSAERFKREILLAARLQHPHIVPLLSAGDASGLPWFSMPFVEGESLRARLLREGELPVAEAVRVLREIASALAYAHGRGIVHRDIKPENVLVSEGAVMVTDFGVAKALSAAADGHQGTLTSLGIALGTPAYMAPEQAAADPRTDYRADIYAWGILAYELLAGRTPFSGRTPQAMLAAHVTQAPEPLERLRPAAPPSLAQLVMRSLEKHAADRPQSAAEVVAALDAISTSPGGTAPHSPAAVSAEGPVTVATSVARLRPAPWTIASAVAVLLAVTLGGAWMWRLNAAPALSERRVAVLPFQNLTGSAEFDHVGTIAADWLTQSMAQVDSLDVVSSIGVRMALGDAKGSDPELMRRLVAVTRAGLVVTGTVARQGDSLRVQAQLVDPITGQVRSVLDPAVGPASDPIAAIDALRERLLGALTISEFSRVIGTRPPKYSAYRELVLGAERFHRFQDYAGSLPFLNRAIALDSTFVLPYSLLMSAYWNLGMYDSAEVVQRRLERFRDRLSASERLMMEFHAASIRGDLEGELRAQMETAARDSNPISLYLVGWVGIRLLRPDVAIPALERGDSLILARGWVHQSEVLAEAYHQAGAHDNELATLLRGRKRFPNRAFIPARQLRAYAGLRQATAALALADTLLRGIPDSVGSMAGNVLQAALDFRAHGDTATFERLARLSLDWFVNNPVPTASRARALQEGRAYYLLGRLDSAEARFVLAARDSGNLDPLGYLGLVRARRGDTSGARTIADSLGELQRKWLFGSNTFWSGAIYGALGERERAVQLLRRAQKDGAIMQSWHFHSATDALRGYSPFEEMIRPRR